LDSLVASYQNGLNEEAIASIIGSERTIGVFVHFGADLVEPGHGVLATQPTTYISELNAEETSRIRQVADVLSAVTPVVFTDNLDGYLWGKLGYAALGFSVSSVDMPIDEVIMVPEAQEVIRAAVAEVVDVAHEQGIRFENIHGFEPNLFDRSNPNRVEETNEMFRRWADESRISIKRHMGIHRDIRFRKRRTEVDFQIGAVVERGVSSLPVEGISQHHQMVVEQHRPHGGDIAQLLGTEPVKRLIQRRAYPHLAPLALQVPPVE
jgi:2-dehydropantoate 2-reductase